MYIINDPTWETVRPFSLLSGFADTLALLTHIWRSNPLRPFFLGSCYAQTSTAPNVQANLNLPLKLPRAYRLPWILLRASLCFHETPSAALSPISAILLRTYLVISTPNNSPTRASFVLFWLLSRPAVTSFVNKISVEISIDSLIAGGLTDEKRREKRMLIWLSVWSAPHCLL